MSIDYAPKSQIPKRCGVYFFHDKSGQILYIGKAINLRNRLGSYFKSKSPDNRIAKILELAQRVSWQETNSEIEALILESQLIKKHKPPFNIKFRDDKQYFYVGFTRDQFPKIFLTHQPKSKRLAVSVERLVKIEGKIHTLNPKPYTLNVNYIGPFTDGDALKTTLRFLRRIFPYCTCKQKHNNYCLNYHINKCLGFCCLKNAELIIKNYELRKYQSNVRHIRDVLNGKQKRLINKLKKEMTDYAKKNEFDRAIESRGQIEKLEKIFQNAQILHNSRLLILNSKNKIQQHAALKKLTRALNLPVIPARIEGYDISNIQGGFATGAMAVFIHSTDSGQIVWRPDKSQYRKFKIKLGDSPNDTAMLKEVLIRRFNHPEWPYPDLIVVDGGVSQLNTAISATFGHRKTEGLMITPNSIPVVALTKNERHRGNHIYISGRKNSIELKKLPPEVRNLILQIDAEAHRFAIGYYRKLHRSRLGATINA